MNMNKSFTTPKVLLVLSIVFVAGCASVLPDLLKKKGEQEDNVRNADAALAVIERDLAKAEADGNVELAVTLKDAKALIESSKAESERKIADYETKIHQYKNPEQAIKDATEDASGWFPAPWDGIISLGGVIAATGLGYYRRKAAKEYQRAEAGKEAIAVVHANRRANGTVNADFSENHNAVMRAYMSKEARNFVREASEHIDPELVEAFNAVSK